MPTIDPNQLIGPLSADADLVLDVCGPRDRRVGLLPALAPELELVQPLACFLGRRLSLLQGLVDLIDVRAGFSLQGVEGQLLETYTLGDGLMLCCVVVSAWGDA